MTKKFGVMPDWDTHRVENMEAAFKNKTLFNGDITKWNTSSVTSIRDMFHSASSFNQDISGWDVSQVTSMSGVFYGASAFDKDISSWNDILLVLNTGEEIFTGSTIFQNITLRVGDVPLSTTALTWPGATMSWSDESGNNNDVILLDGVKFNSKYGGYVSFDASLSNSRGYISNDLHYAGGTKVIEELTVLVWMRTNYSNGENTPDGSYDINQSSFIDFDRSEVFNFYLEGAGQLKFSGSSSTVSYTHLTLPTKA